MAFYSSLLLLPLVRLLVMLPLASDAASIQPSNDTLQSSNALLELFYPSQSGTIATAVAPLTEYIGLNQSPTEVGIISIKGTLISVDAHSRDLVSSTNIAFICCDPNTNSSNLSPTDIINQVISTAPTIRAILLYSLTAPYCSISGQFSYGSILSMTNIKDSLMVENSLETATMPLNATITAQGAASVPSTTPSSTVGVGPGQSSTSQSSAPTTAVAMSILYSITGIITLLFLVIIATGAIRAHRHPERYGPRGGLPGRPRQSRAKGLARAMLETLPIIKFGDGETAKPENTGIELEEGNNEVQQQASIAVPPTRGAEGETELRSTEETTVPETGIGPDTHVATEISHTEAHGASENLGCSICTDDFEKGEDVRVLPCNHKFHPACVDPWLLNVSGTCPLCRVDLRPAETNTTETEPSAEEEAALPPPLTETEGADAHVHPTRNRLSRRLDAALMRNASSHERMAALRQLRQQQVEADAVATGPDAEREEQSRRTRLTNRLRDAFRIRTRRMSEPVATVEPEAFAAPARTEGIEETL